MKKMSSRNTTSIKGAMSSCPFLISVLRLSRALNLIVVSLFSQNIQKIRRAPLHVQHKTVHAADEIIIRHECGNRDAQSEHGGQERLPDASRQVPRVDGRDTGGLALDHLKRGHHSR